MKEMIQNIIDIESKTYNQEQLYMLTALKVTALMLLEKEKEQIMDAHLNGQSDHHFSLESRMAEGEDYYKQIYNK